MAQKTEEAFLKDLHALQTSGLDTGSAFVAGVCTAVTGLSLEVVSFFLSSALEAYRGGTLGTEDFTRILRQVYDGKLGLAKETLEDALPPLAKRGSSGHALEYHGSFSKPIDIEGRSFARNPHTGLITSKEDAEMIERILALQSMEDERQMREDEAIARLLAEEEKARPQPAVLPSCLICMEVITERELQPLDNCGHMFHDGCIGKHFEIKINESSFPVECPVDTCKREVTMFDLKTRLSPELIAKFEDFTFNHYVASHKAALITCPTPNCKYVFLFNNETSFQCPLCEVNYCLRCMTEYHKGLTCDEYRASKDVGALDAMFAALVNGQHFKQCPHCKFWVEKTVGCDHMRCRCGGEFCYKCGGNYGNCLCMQAAVPQPLPRGGMISSLLERVMPNIRRGRWKVRRYR